eukprot:CAMPEP_0174854024 /NCGR_PEP_ID=MMETSP1114-20130205/29719_1 /TAXON_ID=312471 /ORGANISM="Neobodo designis, Strain CCAP 1951/1" /LENGTH=561 /DNA_ID=CAMNT_0016088697 /DNA_START=42 /DNA_END=1723 /DNA_ORIENTATION=+
MSAGAVPAFIALVSLAAANTTISVTHSLSPEPFPPTASVSPTVSSTWSLRKRSQLLWATAGPDPDFTPVVEDRALQRGNWSALLRIVNDEFNAAALRTDESEKNLNVSLPFATVSQARGLLGRIAEGALIESGSVQMVSDDVVRFTLFPDAFLQLKVDEVLAIGFYGNATVSGEPPLNQVFLRVTATPVESHFGFIGALGGLSALGAAMTISLGMPGLHQMQSLALVGAMTCTDRSVQGFTVGSEYFLSPLPVHDSAAGRLASCILLGVYIAAAHGLSCRTIRSNVARMPLREAMSRTFFPSVPYGAVVVLFPGFIYFSGGFAYQVIDGGLTVVIFSSAALALTLLGVMVHVLHTSRSFLDRRFAFRDQTSSSEGLAARTLHPAGFWGPPEILRMYRSVLWPLASHSDKFMFIVFAESATVAIVTSFQPSTPSGCKAQFGFVALCVLTFGVVYATKAPYRHPLDNVLSVLTCVALAVMAFTAAIVAPESDQVRDAYIAALSLGIVAGCARCVFALWWAIDEHRRGVEAMSLAPRGERRVRLPEGESHSPSAGEIPVVESDG